MTLSSLMTLKLDLLCRMFTFKTSLNPLLSEKYPAAGSHLEKVFQKVSDLKNPWCYALYKKYGISLRETNISQISDVSPWFRQNFKYFTLDFKFFWFSIIGFTHTHFWNVATFFPRPHFIYGCLALIVFHPRIS